MRETKSNGIKMKVKEIMAAIVGACLLSTYGLNCVVICLLYPSNVFVVVVLLLGELSLSRSEVFLVESDLEAFDVELRFFNNEVEFRCFFKREEVELSFLSWEELVEFSFLNSDLERELGQ
ncbi:hypothetical protein COLO4_24781 [Corchorus olitorius]|uniref:Uncharacterized protein n=1 Tax=Corchorus olitorius TaxID=93759 RepID=A0A1R3I741_9ROSI|nr:hypothetical protein COLO4_24781 [Corchorus olitorius]